MDFKIHAGLLMIAQHNSQLFFGSLRACDGQGCLTLNFFERRATRQLFGLVSHEERVV